MVQKYLMIVLCVVCIIMFYVYFFGFYLTWAKAMRAYAVAQRLSSVVRPASNFYFKQLLKNHQANFNQTGQETFLQSKEQKRGKFWQIIKKILLMNHYFKCINMKSNEVPGVTNGHSLRGHSFI